MKVLFCVFMICSTLMQFGAIKVDNTANKAKESVTLYSIDGAECTVVQNKVDGYLSNGWFLTRRDAMQAFYQKIEPEFILWLGENHNRLAEFCEGEPYESEFATEWVFYRFTGLDNDDVYGNVIAWDEKDVISEYEMFFGVEMPKLLNTNNVAYKNGKYYINASDPSCSIGEFDCVEFNDDNVEVTFKLNDGVSGEWIGSETIYKIIPKNNVRGFCVISKNTKRVND